MNLKIFGKVNIRRWCISKELWPKPSYARSYTNVSLINSIYLKRKQFCRETNVVSTSYQCRINVISTSYQRHNTVLHNKWTNFYIFFSPLLSKPLYFMFTTNTPITTVALYCLHCVLCTFCIANLFYTSTFSWNDSVLIDDISSIKYFYKAKRFIRLLLCLYAQPNCSVIWWILLVCDI